MRPGSGWRTCPDKAGSPGSIPGRGAPPGYRAADGRSSSTKRPGTAGPAASSAWSGSARCVGRPPPSECDADRAEGSADRGGPDPEVTGYRFDRATSSIEADFEPSRTDPLRASRETVCTDVPLHGRLIDPELLDQTMDRGSLGVLLDELGDLVVGQPSTDPLRGSNFGPRRGGRCQLDPCEKTVCLVSLVRIPSQHLHWVVLTARSPPG